MSHNLEIINSSLLNCKDVSFVLMSNFKIGPVAWHKYARCLEYLDVYSLRGVTDNGHTLSTGNFVSLVYIQLGSLHFV